MPGLTDGEPRSRLDDTDDESDLVYHIVCSRDRPDGAPMPPLRAGEAWWLSRDHETPRTVEMPARYEIVLRRMVEFSRDVMRHRGLDRSAANELLAHDIDRRHRPGTRAIAELFSVADWLAMHYQRRSRYALWALYVFAGLAGFCFIAYSDLSGLGSDDLPVLGVHGGASAPIWFVSRGGWQRRYPRLPGAGRSAARAVLLGDCRGRTTGGESFRPRRVSEAAGPRTRLDPKHAARRRANGTMPPDDAPSDRGHRDRGPRLGRRRV